MDSAKQFKSVITTHECVVAEGAFPTSEKILTSGIIPKLGIQFPMLGNSSEQLPDIGKRFPMSGNSFRYRKTVSDVGERFPMSEKCFRCRIELRKHFSNSEFIIHTVEE